MGSASDQNVGKIANSSKLVSGEPPFSHSSTCIFSTLLKPFCTHHCYFINFPRSSWEYFPHDHARSRAYRWGEDGLLGITDRECRLCFALSLWNGKDSILKERLFGLTGPEGNHGEDCKELYYYLDSTPTHSYMKGLYKYPQVCLCVCACVYTCVGVLGKDTCI